jgi:hypothetical protein
MDQDVARGRPSIITMVADGRLVGPVTTGAETLRSEALGLLAKGPPPLAAERRDALRYEITDLSTICGIGALRRSCWPSAPPCISGLRI